MDPSASPAWRQQQRQGWEDARSLPAGHWMIEKTHREIKLWLGGRCSGESGALLYFSEPREGEGESEGSPGSVVS